MTETAIVRLIVGDVVVVYICIYFQSMESYVWFCFLCFGGILNCPCSWVLETSAVQSDL